MKPNWSGVKSRLGDVDRAGLIGLIHDLYKANKDNQAFLHARFGVGDDLLRPYKVVISRWLWPDWFKNQDFSVAKARKAIADYKKAIGQPAGVAELSVFYCETAAGCCTDVGVEDEGYFDALIRVFEQSLKAIELLPERERKPFIERMERVRRLGQEFGYGVGVEMNAVWRGYGVVVGQ